MGDRRVEVDEIEIDRDRHVHIVFADGYAAHFDVEPLRLACPCAQCRARRDAGRPVAASGPPVEVADARLVGAWGLGIEWNDGHGTGIYAWDVLRAWAERGDGAPTFVRSDLPSPADVARTDDVAAPRPGEPRPPTAP